MPTFLHNMMNANNKIICTAKGSDVSKVSVAFLLSSRLRIPIFQRRYCWGRDQWHTLLSDALCVADGAKEKHSLGRITCVRGDPRADDRLVVVDGQQRNTTCSLLLAAIRDVASSRGSDAACQALAAELDAALLPDAEGFESWLAAHARENPGARAATVVAEGEALDFAALVPTYCDRASYFAAILPHRAAASAVALGEWQRPMEAKLFFFDEVAAFSADRLRALADTVLHKLEWLFFPISLWDGHRDGTEDLNIIYERLAERDATFCKPSRDSEYASMGSADFIRNLVLGSFQHEADAIIMYKQHWLPIEQAAAAAARRNCTSAVSAYLEHMLDAFLQRQPEKPKQQLAAPLMPGAVGGQLYARFRHWLSAAMEAEGPEDGELRAEALLRRLHAFALSYLESAEASVSAEPPPKAGVGLGRPPKRDVRPHSGGSLALGGVPEGGSAEARGGLGRMARELKGRMPGPSPKGVSSSTWRCARCKFPNPPQLPNCTACSLARPSA